MTQVPKEIIADLRNSTPGSVPIITFELFQNYANVKLDGIEKAISIGDLKSILDKQLDEVTEGVSLAMPPNCFIFSKSATGIQMNCYFPEVIREIKYRSYSSSRTEVYKVPFPNTIIYLNLEKSGDKWSLQTLRYFCTHKRVTALPFDKVISKTDTNQGIFLMPFTNFYNDGRMCFGQNTCISTFPENNLRGVEWLYQVIFDGIFNDDLGINGLTSNYSAPTFYEKLSKLTAFPYNLLKGYKDIAETATPIPNVA